MFLRGDNGPPKFSVGSLGASESPGRDGRPTLMTLKNLPSSVSAREETDGTARPDGADLDAVLDQVASGERCRFCGCALDGQTAEQIDGQWYHSEACATEHRQKAPPEPRKSRIKRGRAAK